MIDREKEREKERLLPSNFVEDSSTLTESCSDGRTDKGNVGVASSLFGIHSSFTSKIIYFCHTLSTVKLPILEHAT